MNGPERELSNILLEMAGATLERLPVQYEVTIETNDYKADLLQVKAYGVSSEDAEEVANFVRRLRATFYAPEGDGE